MVTRTLQDSEYTVFSPISIAKTLNHAYIPFVHVGPNFFFFFDSACESSAAIKEREREEILGVRSRLWQEM